MPLFELFLIAVGLSMDAFAVSVCKGLSMRRIRVRDCIAVGLWFGIFQAAMPTAGYFLGKSFSEYITDYDHWIAFALLAFLGIRMLIEAIKQLRGCECDENVSATLKIKEMFLLSVATSIDALAAGISFALLDCNIFAAAAFIGAVTFTLSAAGVKIGSVFGGKFKSWATLAGGIILTGMGLKILIEHLSA